MDKGPATLGTWFPSMPWPLPPSPQKMEKREKIPEKVYRHQNWKRQIPLLLMFHWPELVTWPHEAAEEAGNCHQPGGKGSRFGEQWPASPCWTPNSRFTSPLEFGAHVPSPEGDTVSPKQPVGLACPSALSSITSR